MKQPLLRALAVIIIAGSTWHAQASGATLTQEYDGSGNVIAYVERRNNEDLVWKRSR
jgi:YD repeat-containing protein